MRRRHRSRIGLLGVVTALLLAFVPAPVASASPPLLISDESEQILQSMLVGNGDRSGASVSGRFLGTPYGANTLVGSEDVPEELVVELQRVDCFTYADYVEALKRADTRDEFINSLIAVRYKAGVVSFANRKHFFTDWAAAAPAVATDVTESLSGNVIRASKSLNAKDSGGVYLPGLPVVERAVTYLPSERVDANVVSRLRTGDYIGAYAEDGGLDVTHVGIFIDTADGPMFRNASSLSALNSVVDTPLAEYLNTVPGVVVLRPVV